MAEELGKIEKPEAASFTGKRKIYIVPLIFSGENAPAEYVEKHDMYWKQVAEHLSNLETKLGKVTHIYNESISESGENGLKMLEKLNPSAYRIVKDKCRDGAILEATEDRDLVGEAIDWERCLMMGFISQNAAGKVSQLYLESQRKRFEYIAHRIDETLKPAESGLFLIREGHGVQFSSDIEVFNIAPPALDEIRRWQRNHVAAEEESEAENERH